jgi:hypothetical protein
MSSYRHYKLTEETMTLDKTVLHRIQALRDIPRAMVRVGDLGGWIEREENLSDSGWVDGEAKVYGDARVSEDAQVYGYAEVYGSAKVYGSARVFGYARVFESAEVYGDARVYGDPWVYGEARVFGYARVYGDARVYDFRKVYGSDEVYNNAQSLKQEPGPAPTERSTERSESTDSSLPKLPKISIEFVDGVVKIAIGLK